jgi:hypothetical protein
MSASGNFSGLSMLDTQNCTNPQGTDAMSGVIENDFCIIDYAVLISAQSGEWDNVTVLYNETWECVIIYVNDTSEGCLQIFGNISISGRVMWTEHLSQTGSLDEDGNTTWITTSYCLVYIESQAFIPSSQYNRTHLSSSPGVDWDELWADPAYEQWENERMSAYSVEEANAPSWCTTPQFDALYWLYSPADTTPEPVQYVGFLDNTSVHGYRMNQGEKFSKIFMPIDEENCTTTGHDDWLGMWDEPFCVQDLYPNAPLGYSISYNETVGCLSVSNQTGHVSCLGNMSISSRVMWYEVMTDVCAVFISSEQFIPSSSYNLTSTWPNEVDWDDQWADPAYVAWEAERMTAYNAEVANQPSWCTDPMLNFYYWAIQPAS